MYKFSLFAIKNLYLKLIFNSLSGNCDPLFSQKKFDNTHFGWLLSGGFGTGGVQVVSVLEPCGYIA